MLTQTKSEEDRDMMLLEQIEHNPDVTQASLAAQLGVAVGTVNWHIKRLVKKGFVKVKRAQRRKLLYIITPEGIAHRASLTVNYIETSMRLYRRVRRQVSQLLDEVHKSGYDQVHIDGDGDIADICKLTCLEHNIKIIEAVSPVANDKVPVLIIHGTKVHLHMEAEEELWEIK